MIRRWKVGINRKCSIGPDENETVDFNGDFCDAPVDQKQKRHLRYAQRGKRKCLYLMMLKLVPKEGEPTKWITCWVLLPEADQFKPFDSGATPS